MLKVIYRVILGSVVLSLAGCVTPPPKKDYTALRSMQPKSILVLPPLNQSIEENASYSYLSTVTKPLAEMGYYVYPVAVVDAFLKENGLPTPGEMHQISLDKIDQIIGPDAVLYLTVLNYGSKYQVLDSSTNVSARARLVDVKTGNELWSRTVTTVQSSSSGGGGIAEMLVAAAISQVINSSMDAGHGVSRTNNFRLFTESGQGLIYGHRNEKFGTDLN
ncbi:MAG: GNA1162 family protein [Verrucomicrobiota bacterium]